MMKKKMQEPEEANHRKNITKQLIIKKILINRKRISTKNLIYLLPVTQQNLHQMT